MFLIFYWAEKRHLIEIIVHFASSLNLASVERKFTLCSTWQLTMVVWSRIDLEWDRNYCVKVSFWFVRSSCFKCWFSKGITFCPLCQIICLLNDFLNFLLTIRFLFYWWDCFFARLLKSSVIYFFWIQWLKRDFWRISRVWAFKNIIWCTDQFKRVVPITTMWFTVV